MRRFRNDILLVACLAVLAAFAMHHAGASPPPEKAAPPPSTIIAADLRTSERRPVRIVYQPFVEAR